MKHYLYCIALVLCVSGSAYANKGGSVSAHIKAAVESKLGRQALADCWVFSSSVAASLAVVTAMKASTRLLPSSRRWGLWSVTMVTTSILT